MVAHVQYRLGAVHETPDPEPVAFDIRDAVAADAARLSAFVAELFRNTYASTTRPEDLEAYVAAHFAAPLQATEIADPAWRTILAEVDGTLAGFAQMRRGAAPPGVPGSGAPGAAMEITRFYVAPSWRGRGLAQTLMDACLRTVPTGTPTWLGVYTKNPRAVAFYEKCGFRIVGETTFPMGSDLQRDYVMVLGSGSRVPSSG